jgi:hypothetical protein
MGMGEKEREERRTGKMRAIEMRTEERSQKGKRRKREGRTKEARDVRLRA